MATSSYLVAVLAISFLIFLQTSSAANDTNSSVSSYLNELCKEVECGKGKCKASLNYTYNFICECEPGWTQRRYDYEDDQYRYEDHRFLPCVIPNCSMDYSCGKAPPPVPQIQESPKNISFFDPCFWTYCGEGSCNKSLRYGHRCECNAGFKNLLNISAYPCLSDCVIGSDCGRLGITVSNDSAVSNPNSSAASSILPESVIGSIMIVILSFTIALWK